MRALQGGVAPEGGGLLRVLLLRFGQVPARADAAGLLRRLGIPSCLQSAAIDEPEV
jgi:hypothetical protein